MRTGSFFCVTYMVIYLVFFVENSKDFMKGTLIELLREKHFLLQPDFFVAARNRILSDPSGVSLETQEKKEAVQGFYRFCSGSVVDSFATGKIWMGDALRIDHYEENLGDDDCIVNVVRLTSAMTRGGGECSYGSIQLRDLIMEASDVEKCIGHIIYTRTPGGAASSLRDFRMAIDYAHSKGKKVYMFCDGDVASGGTFLAAMCDGVYFMNPDDEIGSIGMYSAFFTMADGAKNSITEETYHEYYATRSTEKNKWARDAAEGNMDTVAKQTEEFLDELLADLKADRPAIKKEQMTGAMYKMKDVIGSLVDGQSTMDELAQKIFNESNSIKKASAPAGGGNLSNNNNTMSKQYIQISAFLGSSVALESDKDGGVYLQAHQADELEKKIPNVAGREMELTEKVSRMQETIAEQQKLVASLTGERDSLKNQVKELTDKMVGSVAGDDVAALKKELEDTKASLAKAQEENATLTSNIESLKEKSNDDDQLVSDLKDKLSAYETGPGERQSAGKSPKTNGMQPSSPHLEEAPKWDDRLSVTENMNRIEEYKKSLNDRAAV